MDGHPRIVKAFRWVSALLAAILIAAVFFTFAVNSAQPPYPSAKQTFEAGSTRTRAAALSIPTPLAGPRPPPTVTAIAPNAIARRPAGAGWILDDFSSPFPAMSHVITNMWYEETDGKRIDVYAGALRENPGISLEARQSVIIVIIENTDGSILPGGGTYRAPVAAGAIRITEAINDRLVLQSENGTKFYFDVPTRAFGSTSN
jgi:hypothetical protein